MDELIFLKDATIIKYDCDLTPREYLTRKLDKRNEPPDEG